MKYVIERLQRELIFETECRADAIEHLTPTGTKVMALDSAREQTRAAFIESLKLAEERIPQLSKALEILSQPEKNN